MRTKKLLGALSLAAIAAISLASCDKENSATTASTNNKALFQEETIQYNKNLDNSNLFKTTYTSKLENTLYEGDIDETTPQDVKEALLSAGFSSSNFKAIPGYTSTYKEVNVSQAQEEVSSWGVDEDIVYPGSVVRIQDPTLTKSALETYGVNTGNITISSSMYTSTGTKDDSIKRDIETAKASNIKSAVHELISSNLVNGSHHACKLSTSTYEVSTVEDLSTAMNTSLMGSKSSDVSKLFSENAGFWKFSESIDYSKMGFSGGNTKLICNNNTSSGKSTYYACIEITQEYYNISVDPIMNAEDIILDNLDDAKLEELRRRGGVPGYVSNVKYGRKALCVLKLDCSYEEYLDDIKKKETTTGGSAIDKLFGAKTIFTDIKSENSESKEEEQSASEDQLVNKSLSNHVLDSKCFIYGGDVASSIGAVTGTSAKEVLEAFTSSVDPEMMVGVPISYTIRSLDGSNSVLRLGSYDSYFVRELTPIVPTAQISYSADDVDFIENEARLGSEYILKPIRTPEDAILYDFDFDVRIDNPNIKKSAIANGAKYSVDGDDNPNNKILIYKDVNNLVIKIGDYKPFIDVQIEIVTKYVDSTFEKFSKVDYITIKDKTVFTATFKDCNGNTISTQTASADNNYKVIMPMPVNDDGIKLSGWYTNISDRSTKASSIMTLTEDMTFYLPSLTTVYLHSKSFEDKKVVFEYLDPDWFNYIKGEIDNYDNYIVKYFTNKTYSNVYTPTEYLDESYFDIYVLMEEIPADVKTYTITYYDSIGNYIDEDSEIGNQVYTLIPAEYDGQSYSGWYDENNVKHLTSFKITEDLVLHLPRKIDINFHGEDNTDFKQNKIVVEEFDSNIYSVISNNVAVNTIFFDYQLFTNSNMTKELDSNVTITKDINSLDIYIKKTKLQYGTQTLTYELFKNIAVKYLGEKKNIEHYVELNKNALYLEDILRNFEIKVDYATNSVTVTKYEGKYYFSYGDYGDDDYWDQISFNGVSNPTDSIYYGGSGADYVTNNCSINGITQYGWTIAIKVGNNIVYNTADSLKTDNIVTINNVDLSNVEFYIVADARYCEHEAYDYDWVSYDLVQFSLNLEKYRD